MPTDFIGLFALLAAGRSQDLADIERLQARLRG